jgi:hypothetical protein
MTPARPEMSREEYREELAQRLADLLLAGLRAREIEGAKKAKNASRESDAA